MKKLRILVVEDFETYTNIRHLGYTCFYSKSIKSVERLATKKIPDVILLTQDFIARSISPLMGLFHEINSDIRLNHIKVGSIGHSFEVVEFSSRTKKRGLVSPIRFELANAKIGAGVFMEVCTDGPMPDIIIEQEIEKSPFGSLPIHLKALEKEVESNQIRNLSNLSDFISGRSNNLPPLLYLAAKFILANMDNPDLNYHHVSKAVSFHISTVNRKFGALTGLSCNEFITYVRIEYSKKILSETLKPIKLIAYEIGFDTPCRFTQEFTRFCGMSPRRFRNSLQNS